MPITIFPTLNLLARPGRTPPVLRHARTGSATRIDATGALVAVPADVARHDFERAGGVYRGWRLEGPRTNLVLNSLAPAGQTLTLAAGTYTLSLVGGGGVTATGVLSGTATEAAPLTQTVAAGTTTLSLTGDVRGLQLESGAYATSLIPTGGGQVTRAAESARVDAADFPLKADEGTLYVQCSTAGHGGLQTALELGDGSEANRIVLRFDTARAPQAVVFAGGTSQLALTAAPVAAHQTVRMALAYRAGSAAFCVDGGAVQTAAPGTIPTAASLWLGSEGTITDPLNGHIMHAAYFPRRLADADLHLLTR